MAALYEAGYDLFVPFGEDSRSDLVTERNGELARVQIKSGRLRHGCVQFAVCSTYGHHPTPALVRRPYHGEIDAFCVYCRETQRVYLIPIADVTNTTACWLRVDPPKTTRSTACAGRATTRSEPSL
jgi:hypothetical protein